MPNLTHNYLSITGKEADIREFLTAIKSDESLFDFDNITPMPELLRRTGHGNRTIDGKNVDSWYEVEPFAGDFKNKVRLFTAQELDELRAIGHLDPSDWASGNWGTPANSIRVEINDKPIGEGRIEICFDTELGLLPSPYSGKSSDVSSS